MKKYKKNIIWVLLVAMLGTTSCIKKEESNLFEREEKLESVLENNAFLKEENVFGETYYEIYDTTLDKYLDKFSEYMDETQFENLLRVAHSISKSTYDCEYLLPYFDEILGVQYDSTNYGDGFFRYFNMAVLNDLYLHWYSNQEDAKIYKEMNTLCSIINSDDLYQAIFSKDINSVIDVITEKSGCLNKDIVRELIMDFDICYNTRKSDLDIDIMAQEEASKRIKDNLAYIINVKLITDKEMASSFFGRIIKDSNYFGNDNVIIKTSIFGNGCMVRMNDSEYESLSFYMSDDYVYSKDSLEEIKHNVAIDIIKQAKEQYKDGYPYTTMMDEMTFLLNEDTVALIGNNYDYQEVWNLMYSDLAEYFYNKSEFDAFLIKLDAGAIDVNKKYFDIYRSRLTKKELNISDYLNYQKMLEYIQEESYSHYDFYNRDDYIPYDELRKLKKEEYESFVYNMQDCFAFGGESLNTYLDSIEEILCNSSLDYDYILSSSGYQKDWFTGSVGIDNVDNNMILSDKTKPQSMNFKDMNVVYYEYPLGYEGSTPVETFLNIDNKLIAREFNGLVTNLPDSDKTIFIVGFDKDIANYPELRFMMKYNDLVKKHENVKKLGE